MLSYISLKVYTNFGTLLGNQTTYRNYNQRHQFESSVISYGNQTIQFSGIYNYLFESSVISYGNQT